MLSIRCLDKYKIDDTNSRQADLLSATINFLKFPLAVLVVILHANLLTKPLERVDMADLELISPAFTLVTWLLSRFLAYLAVPSFFVVSGFLLFYNVDRLNRFTYKSKLRRRFHTLVVPYLVWNVIYLIIYWAITPQRVVLSEVPDIFSNASPIQFFYVTFIKPIDGPLWFIRNLFVMVILSPVFYWTARRTGLLLPALLLVLTQFAGSSIVESLLWFSVGVSLSVMRIDFLRLCRTWLPVTLSVTLITIAVDILLYPHTGSHIVGHFALFKIMAGFGLGYLAIEKHREWADCKVLNQSTFVIYAYHSIPQLLLIGNFLPFLCSLNIVGGGVFDLFCSNYTHCLWRSITEYDNS